MMLNEDISTEFTYERIAGGRSLAPGPPKLHRRPSTNMNIDVTDKIAVERKELSTKSPQSDEEPVNLSQHTEQNDDSDESNLIDQSDDNHSFNEDEEKQEDDVEESETDSIVSPHIEHTDTKLLAPRETKSFYFNFIFSSIMVIIVVAILIKISGVTESFTSSPSSADTIDIKTIKAEFPLQDDELWISFESGVKDVVTFNKPSTFILLYENKSENTVKNLTSRLSKFAICNITECGNIPITLTESELNSPEIIQDYGELIDRYRCELEHKGVMVIKNLEKIRGISAQAFHTFCDEFTPLVKQSLFIFTMKVDKLPGKNKMKFVEDDLKKRWSEVKTDTLVALITRITSMVIEIL